MVVLWWILISLLGISFVADYPIAVFVGGAAGGVLVGFHSTKNFPNKPCISRFSEKYLWIFRYEMIWISIACLFLLFSRRFPLWLSLWALLIVVATLGIRSWLCKNKTPIDIPVILIMLLALGGIFISVDSFLTRIGVFKMLAGIGVCFSLINWLEGRFNLRWILISFAVLAIIIGLSGPFFMELSRPKLPLISRFYAFIPEGLPKFFHFNFIGGVLTFFFPICFWNMIQDWKKNSYIFFLSTLISGSCLIFTQSRGSLLGVIISLSIIGAYYKRWLNYMYILKFGIFLGIISLNLYIGFFELSEVIISTDTGVSRIEIWSRTISIIQDFPFTGVGLLVFPIIVDMFYPLELLDAQVPHPHNVYLDVAVSMGLPGFIAFGILLGSWAYMLWDSLKLSWCLKDKNWHFAALGFSGSAIAHLSFSMTDAMLIGWTAGIIFWIVIGISVAMWRQLQYETAMFVQKGAPSLNADTIG